MIPGLSDMAGGILFALALFVVLWAILKVIGLAYGWWSMRWWRRALRERERREATEPQPLPFEQDDPTRYGDGGL